MAPDRKRLSAPDLRTRISIGVAGITVGVVQNGIIYFLLVYYSEVLGLEPSLAGLALLIALLFDAVSDPVVGRWSDQFRSRLGRRHPFIYGSILPGAVFYYFLWNPPELAGAALFAYLTATAIALRLAITFYVVPILAMIPELSSDYDERTRLFNYMVSSDWFFGTVMMLVMYGYWLADRPEFPTGILRAAGYEESGTAGAVVILIAMVAAAWGTHHNIPRLRAPPPRDGGLLASLRQMRQTVDDPSFLALLIAGVFNAAGSGTSEALWIYVQPYFWGFSSEQLSWMVAAQLGSAVLAFSLLPYFSIRGDKRSLLIGLSVASIVVGSGPVVLRLLGWFPANGDPMLFPVMLTAGVVLVTLIIMSFAVTGSMISDVVEARELVTGRREEGTLVALQSFLYKAAGAIGVWMAGIILSVIEFPLNAEPHEVSAETIRNLGIAYGPALAVPFAAAVVAVTYYRIDRKGHRKNLDELAARSPVVIREVVSRQQEAMTSLPPEQGEEP